MKKCVALLLALTILLGMTSCGRGSGELRAIKPAQDPMEITVGMWGLSDTKGKPATGKMADMLYERLGVKIIPWQMDRENAYDRIMEAAAAGNLPDMFAQDVFDDKVLYQFLMDTGNIRSIPSSLYEKYPNVKNAIERAAVGIPQPDVVYFVPRTQMAFEPDAGNLTAIYYNKKWAAGLNFPAFDTQAPTWQQFMDMLDAFTHKDPDHNDKSDTVGLEAYGEGLGGLQQAFFMAFGVRDWVWQGDQWVPGLTSDKAKEAAKWASVAWRGGLVDQNMPLMNEDDAMGKFCAGKAGMLVMDGSPAGAARLEAKWAELRPDVDINENIALLPQPISPYGVAYNDTGNFQGGTLFSAKLSDKKLSRALQMMDWLYSADGLLSMQYGQQGRDYQVDNGVPKTLLTNAAGQPVQYAGADDPLYPLLNLSTWAKDATIPALRTPFENNALITLKAFWWPNDWRRDMFTRYMLSPEVSTFDMQGIMQSEITRLMATSADIETDWGPYLANMEQQLGISATQQEVNRYAQEKGITGEE